MPRLSIIIPVLGDPQQFESTLVSVLENRPEDSQIVLALNRPYDDPYELEGEVEFVHLPQKAGWADELNAAWAVCRAEIVAVLACGTEVTPDWTEHVLAAFDDPRVTSAAPMIVRHLQQAGSNGQPADDAARCNDSPAALPENAPVPANILPMANSCQETVVSLGLGYGLAGEVFRLAEGRRPNALRRSYRPIGPDALAGFFRRRAVERVGGWTALGGPTLCHADLALRLQAIGSQCVPVAEMAVRFDAPTLAWERENPVTRGWHSERFFWRWAARRGRWTGTIAHLGLCVLRGAAGIIRPSVACEMLGRLAAIAALPWSQLSPPEPASETTVDQSASPTATTFKRRAA